MLINAKKVMIINKLKESYSQLGIEIADLLYSRECCYALNNPKFLSQIQAENNLISEQLDLLIVANRDKILEEVEHLAEQSKELG